MGVSGATNREAKRTRQRVSLHVNGIAHPHPLLWSVAPQEALFARLERVREATERLVEPLALEDLGVQTMPDVSPTKWHLAHTTWFFEAFVLAAAEPGFEPFHPRYAYLFNSYYEGVGPRVPRASRGQLSRPTIADVVAYRRVVDERLRALAKKKLPTKLLATLELGVHHEQQHQELILTDIKHVLGSQPLEPAYTSPLEHARAAPRTEAPLRWLACDGGLVELGASSESFSFDHERPPHHQFLEPFALASRPATNAEYIEFIEDGGYRRPELWLADGFARAEQEGWRLPLYWSGSRETGYTVFTLTGRRAVAPREPVCHLSYFEADAFARWAQSRLPTEAEWEAVAGLCAVEGNFVESGRYHPAPAPRCDDEAHPLQMFGDVWEWTQSHYGAYPGFVPFDGTLGEYNGKFMCNQLVLRGGSCASPASHLRASYRNFFPPHARWQFSGVRLARST